MAGGLFGKGEGLGSVGWLSQVSWDYRHFEWAQPHHSHITPLSGITAYCHMESTVLPSYIIVHYPKGPLLALLAIKGCS